MVARALMSSDNEHWNTPQNVLDALAPLGGIALDPCSNATSKVDSWFTVRFDQGEDGLTAGWQRLCHEAELETESSGSAKTLCFVNAPYPITKGWAHKIVFEASRGCEIVALVPARTDTAWWTKMATSVDVIAFWRGRLKFGEAANSAPFPSALLYWGPRVELFCSALRPHANLMVRTRESQLASQER